jgi:diaminopropionate ammonia-lyase
VAGLAALARLRSDAALSAQAGLDASSRVLIISTEGATAPGEYAQRVGETAESVLQRQQAWLATRAR